MLDLEGGAIRNQSKLALARKWRPRLFAEVVGQQHAVDVLTGALATGRLHHAFLFTGTRGVGKTTLARILAKAFNCEAQADSRPCGTCATCHAIDAGNFTDVIEMDAASTTQVNNMRALLESAQYAPAAARYKVYIIDEVHMLSRHAFNAMLKTLEEPPDHVKFILATTDPQLVPATVQSRCLRFALHRLSVTEIAEHLAKVVAAEGHPVEDEALVVIATHADGSMRDALSILDEAIAGNKLVVDEVRKLVGAAGPDLVGSLLEQVLDGDSAGLLETTATLHREVVMLERVSADLLILVHEAQLVAIAPELATQVPVAATRAAKELDAIRLQVAYEIVSQGHTRLLSAPEPKVALDMMLLRLVAVLKATDTPATPKPVVKEAQAAPVPTATPTKAVAGSLAAPNDASQWQQLCNALDPRAKSLAHHCAFSSRNGTTIKVQLSHANKVSLSRKAALEKDLSQLCNMSLQLAVELVDQPTRTTPAQQQKQTENAQRAANVAQLENYVEQEGIKKMFPDSKVVPETVHVAPDATDS